VNNHDCVTAARVVLPMLVEATLASHPMGFREDELLFQSHDLLCQNGCHQHGQRQQCSSDVSMISDRWTHGVTVGLVSVGSKYDTNWFL
jgi:hypothetical protein